MEQHELLLLLLKEQQGSLLPEEAARLNAWYDALGGDREPPLLDEAAEAALRNRMHAGIIRQLPPGTPDLPAMQVPHRKRRTLAAILGAAAAVLIGVMVTVYFTRKPVQAPEIQYLSSHTPPGEMMKISLEDGSRIWLNGGSTLRYPSHFNSKTREVYLTGEAFFDIAPQPGQPFTVHTGNLHTLVLGTSFNIRAYAELDQIRISVTSGKVGVRKDAVSLSQLVSDQQLVYHKTTSRFTTSTYRASQASSWREGVIHLDGATFGELAAVLKNNFGYTLQTTRKNISAMRISIDIHTQQKITTIMQAICRISNAQYRIKERVITLY